MWIQPELTASGREQTVTLHPKLVVSGRVTDAETGRPLLNFRVVRGTKLGWRDGIDWSEDMAVDVTNGRYSAPFDQSGEGAFIRIEAKGYKPAVSRAFQPPTEGEQTLDFALQRAADLTGVVLLPDGKPAAGAEVVLASRENQLTMKAGRFDRVVNSPRTATGPDGRFEFPAREGQFLVLAVSDLGYAEAPSDEFAKSGKLLLQPWGTIEGGVRIGARLGAGQEVVFNPIRPEGRRGDRLRLWVPDAERRARSVPIRPGHPGTWERHAQPHHGIPRGHDLPHALLAGIHRGQAGCDDPGDRRRQGPAGDRATRPR